MPAPKPKQLPFSRKILARLVAVIIKALAFTYRVRVDDKRQPLQAAIYCFWHSQLLMPITLYRRLNRKDIIGCPMAGMISASKDGAFLSEVISRFGIGFIRGSSSRRGGQALVEARRTLLNGSAVAITPDGPKGPPLVCKSGPVALARTSRFPVIPFHASASSFWRLKSWDQFIIPKPFALITIRVHSPLHLNDSEESMECGTEKLQVALDQINAPDPSPSTPSD